MVIEEIKWLASILFLVAAIVQGTPALLDAWWRNRRRKRTEDIHRTRKVVRTLADRYGMETIHHALDVHEAEEKKEIARLREEGLLD